MTEEKKITSKQSHRRHYADSSGDHKVTMISFRISGITLFHIDEIFKILHYLAYPPNIFMVEIK